MSKFIWLSLLVTLSVAGSVYSEKILVCYYGTWATYRTGLGKFTVDDVNVDLCTHLVYTFVGLSNSSEVISLDPWLDLPDGLDNFAKFDALKKKNPSLKTILAIGGWNEGSRKYSLMAGSAETRRTFVESAIKFLLKYGFDGFDMDWEYPNQRDTVYGEADVENFTQLLKELKEAMEPHGLLLSLAAASTEPSASLSYDIPAISQYADFISIMPYDIHVATDPKTGHNAPLFSSKVGDKLTVAASLKYWLESGCPPEKLILGLPLYGHTFNLTNADDNGVEAPSSGPGIAGPFTATKGVLAYNEFCDQLKTEKWDVKYDNVAMVPYAVQGTNWLSFDDPDSLMTKVEYGLTLGIGGAMVWSIESDDFHGLCDGEDFPLLRAINMALGRGEVTTNTTTTTTTTIKFPRPSTDLSIRIPSSTRQSTSTSTSTSSSTSTTSSATSTTTTTTTTATTTTTTSTATSTTTSTTTTTETSTTTTTTSPPTTTTSTTRTTNTSTTTSTTMPPSTSTTTSSETSTTTSTNMPPTTSTTTTSTPESANLCKEEGTITYLGDCSKFLYCVRDSEDNFVTVEFECPSNLLWDQTTSACNYPENVDCQ